MARRQALSGRRCAAAIASSRVLNGIRYRIGAKVSFCTIGMARCAARTIVGSTKYPGRVADGPAARAASPPWACDRRSAALHALDRAASISGPISVPGIQRIADPHLLVGRDQPLLHLGSDALVHDAAARGRAALAGRADGAEHDRRQRPGRDRRSSDDDGVVAAELQQAAAEPCRDASGRRGGRSRSSPSSETSATRGSSTNRCPRSLPASISSEKTAEARVGHHHSLQMCWTAIAVSGVLGEGFQMHGVAADRGEEGVPGPDRDREVEGGDDADDAERMPLLVHAVLGPLGVHRQAVEHARLADGEVADVDHLLDFAIALGLDLAHLEADQAAEAVLAARAAPRPTGARPRRAAAPARRATSRKRRGRACTTRS